MGILHWWIKEVGREKSTKYRVTECEDLSTASLCLSIGCGCFLMVFHSLSTWQHDNQVAINCHILRVEKLVERSHVFHN
jgi:hypothetical protein